MDRVETKRLTVVVKCALMVVSLAAFCLLSLASRFGNESVAAADEVVDEAKRRGATVADFPEAAADVFKAMDGGIELTPDEIKGRNTWMMWAGGNEAFWDYLSQHSYGLTDLIKTLDTRKRGIRHSKMGLVSDPDFRQATKPDEFGLWLDERAAPEPEGVDPRVYGKASGIVGLRLFPNPAFDDAARAKWDSKRFYEDAAYYNDTTLVRPYRVGMACSFCHVAPHPLRPPADPENPRWENLSSNIGNQYFNVGTVFGADMTPDSFVYHLLNTTPRGTLDTSLIATDANNNPNSMNPIFNVGARLSVAQEERIAGGALNTPGGEARLVPHVLADGADSIGLIGALNRVFVNIGTFHQEWLRNHNLLIGVRKQKPFEIAKAQRDSVYWQVTANRMDNMAKFFLRAASPMRLEDAPGGKAFLTTDEATLARGKIVFAENCMACHSSKQPAINLDSRSDEYKQWARAEVVKADFRDDNYFSTDRRYPVTEIQTNAGRALATNAVRGHVWDNFSSETYKNLPSVGEIEVQNPFDGTMSKFRAPSGGPGYYRAPTLVSIWATAPFLHNNALGKYTGDPSVAGRMAVFDDSITKMLYPERRDGLNSIWRTSQKSYLFVPAVYLPDAFNSLLGYRSRVILVYPWLLPLILGLIGLGLIAWSLRRDRRRWLTRIAGALVLALAAALMVVSYFFAGERGDLVLGPIPKGTPVNLLANINSDADPGDLARLALKTKRVLKEIESRNLDDAQATELMRVELAPALLEVSKSPDFVEDRGHYFGTQLSDEDKRALIEFLKTL